jgi:hypothetical protein
MAGKAGAAQCGSTPAGFETSRVRCMWKRIGAAPCAAPTNRLCAPAQCASGSGRTSGLSGGDAAHPRVRTCLEVAELRRDGARRFLAELMAADAVDVTHALAPVSRVMFFGISAEPPKSVSGGIFSIAYQ